MPPTPLPIAKPTKKVKKAKVKRICYICGGYLQVFGLARKNGKSTHGDWKGRRTHKSCWVKQQRGW